MTAWDSIDRNEFNWLVANWPGLDVTTRRRAADHYGVTEQYLQRTLGFARWYQNLPVQDNCASAQVHRPATSPAPPLAVQPLAVPDYSDREIVVESDNVVVTSDWHDPFRNWPLWLASIHVARRIQATHYFIVGDLMDNGQEGVSPWDGSWFVGLPSVDATFDVLAKSVRHVQKRTGAQVVITQGNHDVWLDRTTGGQLWVNRLIAGDGVTVSRFHQCSLKTSKGRWLFVHKKYSQVLLRVPAAYRDSEGVHVASAHTHGLGLGVRNGRWIAEMGGLFDPTAMQYLNQIKGPTPSPTPGFMYIQRGDPYIVRDGQDLRAILGDDYPAYAQELAQLMARVKRYAPGVYSAS